MVHKFIESLCFMINMEKSNFIPMQRTVFLGYIIDSVQFKVFLPDEKIQKKNNLFKLVLKRDIISIRELPKLFGLYSSTHYAVLYDHLYHRYLDIDKTKALSASEMTLTHYKCII